MPMTNRRIWTPRFAVLAAAALVAALISPSAHAAPGVLKSYLVTVEKGKNLSSEGRAEGLGGRVGARWESAGNGFEVMLTDQAALELSKTPGVRFVEPNGMAHTTDVQTPATWGLDRIDETTKVLNNSYTYAASAGTGVRAYVIDTGILTTHSEFAGRTLAGINFVNSTAGNSSYTDCNGHGTHVAGTIGGTTYGVAKKVTLIPVRVLDCAGSGSWAGVISGINWVAQQKINNPTIPMVANMSLGGGKSTSVNSAVAAAVAAGVVFGVAAGNGDAAGNPQDACNSSPSSELSAITVGATNNTDTKASWSNYGTCVDIFAPGVSITSSWYSSTTATNTISGTSMATPHVVGAAALYLGTNPSATPAQVATALTSNATSNLVTSPGTGSPNKLLFTGNFVDVVGTTPTITTLDPSTSQSQTFGGTGFSYTATVSETPTSASTVGGSVALKEGPTQLASCTLSSGSCTLTVPSSLAVGAHTLTATYSGNAIFAGSSSSNVSLTVNQGSSSISAVTVNSATIFTNQSLTFSATVTPNTATGCITFNVTGTATLNSPCQPISTGTTKTATWTTTFAGAGSYSVAAVYLGNSNLLGSSSATSANVTVNAPTVPAVINSVTASKGSSRGQIRATWSAPSNGGSAITGYIVTTFTSANVQVGLPATVTTTSATISGLTSGASYYVKVAAKNIVGTQPITRQSNSTNAR